ncbi:hypothetical protein ACFQBQ_12065 [Granulicella cerasi]|uniref:Adenylate cyclase n=1 Tax=Granulicella cerasi TaxID=741063 RepID=A0ABW1ZA51_9BACT|nr:hypothetical protein [Granulicella cerasi]
MPEPMQSDAMRSPIDGPAVLHQLELLLASPLFNQSKRYPAFLRYVVEKTLSDDEEDLKERTIGVEVFGRQPTYDTSLDPTVRLTAAEVRKRLAQYYQQAEHAGQLQIEIRAGSYVPLFSWPQGETQTVSTPAVVAVSEPSPSEAEIAGLQPVAELPSSGGVKWAGITLLVLVILGGVGAWLVLRQRNSEPADKLFWSAVLSDPNPALIVIPDLSKSDLAPKAPESAETTILAHITNSHLVDFNDSVALSNIAAKLGKLEKHFSVRLSSETTYTDLQNGPSILVGAADNPWCLRLMEPLPFRIARRNDTLFFDILQRDKPGVHAWFVDLTQPYTSLQQDYGIVARLSDTMTGRPVLIVAGIGQNGTTAGIRLLTDPELQRVVAAAAPRNWAGRNFEIVFKTQIIQDRFGPPEIVEKAFW